MIWHTRVLLGLSKTIINTAKIALPQLALILPPSSTKWGFHEVSHCTALKGPTHSEFTYPAFKSFDFEAFFLSNSFTSETGISTVSKDLTEQAKEEGPRHKARAHIPTGDVPQKIRSILTLDNGEIYAVCKTQPSLSQFFAANSLATVARLAAALAQLEATEINSKIASSGDSFHEVIRSNSERSKKVSASLDETVASWPCKSTIHARRKIPRSKSSNRFSGLVSQNTCKKRKSSRALFKEATETDSQTLRTAPAYFISSGTKKATAAKFLTYENPFSVLVSGCNEAGKDCSSIVDTDTPIRRPVEPTATNFAAIRMKGRTPEPEDSVIPQTLEIPETPETPSSFSTLEVPEAPETTCTTMEGSPRISVKAMAKAYRSTPKSPKTIKADDFVLVKSKRSKHKNTPAPTITTKKQPFPIPSRDTPECFRKASPLRKPNLSTAKKDEKHWRLVQGKRGRNHSQTRHIFLLDLRSTNSPSSGPPSTQSFSSVSDETSPSVVVLNKIKKSGSSNIKR